MSLIKFENDTKSFSENTAGESIVAKNKKSHIPKIIHQTFYKKTLPQDLEECVNNIKLNNPDWKYRFYDDDDIEEFIQKNYSTRVLKCFFSINKNYGAARADLFRYLLMYKHGGVYLDIKSSINKPLSEFIRDDDHYLLSNWSNIKGDRFEGWGLHPDVAHIENGELQQWYIVAAPNHPFLKAVIDSILYNIENYNPEIHGTGRVGVLRTTGPIAYTLALTPLLPLHKHRFIDNTLFEYCITEYNHKNIFEKHYSYLTEKIINN